MDGALAGVDCDDNDPRRAPGMREKCDNIDNDCSGIADDANACGLWIHNGAAGTWASYALDPAADMGAPSADAPTMPIRFALDVESIDWRSYWLEVQIPGLDRWSLPLLSGERPPDDPPFDLGRDLSLVDADAESTRPPPLTSGLYGDGGPGEAE